jgi:uncharacterized protein (TIGR00730 family)
MIGERARVAVYCGANAGLSPSFAEAARALGDGLARNGIGVVYGGASRGLMGILADAALAAGGEVIGVLPRSLGHRELAHKGLSELHIVETMHERKARIVDLSDAFAVLPGGIGTMDEFFETFTWAQIGIHSRPIALIDVDGFHQPLLAHLRNCVAAGFLSQERMDSLLVYKEVEDFLKFLSMGVVPAAVAPRYAALTES